MASQKLTLHCINTQPLKKNVTSLDPLYKAKILLNSKICAHNCIDRTFQNKCIHMGRILGKMYYCCTFYNIIHALSCQSKFVSIHFTYKLPQPIISGEHLTDFCHSKFNLEHNTYEELSKICKTVLFLVNLQPNSTYPCARYS